MIINDIDIENFNARLIERQITPAAHKIDTFMGDNALTPFINENVKYKEKGLALSVKFNGDFDEQEKNKSKLYKELAICRIEFSKEDLMYEGYLVSTSLDDQNHMSETVEFGLNVIAMEEETTITINDNYTINLQSTAKTPVKLEINPDENIEELEILGFGEDIIIKNLSKDKEIIIDGEKGLVTEEGENKWKDYESWGFPKLSPGGNNISISEDIGITAIYSPRWL